jgi:hypothetical protein
MYDTGGHIPSGQFGIVGENGPEIVNGPANICRPVAVVPLPAGMPARAGSSDVADAQPLALQPCPRSGRGYAQA